MLVCHYAKNLSRCPKLLSDADLNAQGKRAAAEKDPKQCVREGEDLRRQNPQQNLRQRPGRVTLLPWRIRATARRLPGPRPRNRQAAGRSGRLSHCRIVDGTAGALPFRGKAIFEDAAIDGGTR